MMLVKNERNGCNKCVSLLLFAWIGEIFDGNERKKLINNKWTLFIP